jgi:hypothetical protein
VLTLANRHCPTLPACGWCHACGVAESGGCGGEVGQLEAMLALPALGEHVGRADPYTEADMLELHLWLSLDERRSS